jgi:GntR family transcriptional regulator, transcriptional repressor for pyruvate dehydrogenase complex
MIRGHYHIFEEVQNFMEKEVEEGTIGLEGDNAFHDAIALAAENPTMSKILGMCGDLLSKKRETTLRIPGQPKKSFYAIKNGDEIKAAALMKDHMEKAHRNLEIMICILNRTRHIMEENQL